MSIGDADELRADADLLDKMSASILSAYGRSQYEADELKALMDEETWFSAEEALSGLRAAASDITALAASSEFRVPAEKQIVSLSKQIEAITKTGVEVSNELAEQRTKVEEISAELLEACAKVEEAETAKAEAVEAAEQIKAELEETAAQLESKDAEIEQTKEITESAVSAKAAELVQVSAHAPVVEPDENDHKLSSEEFWAEYKRVGDEQGLDAKNVWYAENKHRKN
jgi:chromosome segregation ATPase